MSSNQDPSQNSFVTGFMVGLFAGAAGYFLFATKQGAELRRQLLEDWEDAKHHLAEEGMIERSDISLREFVRDLFNQATTRTEEVEHRLLPEEKMKRIVKASGRKKDSAKKFKGV